MLKLRSCFGLLLLSLSSPLSAQDSDSILDVIPGLSAEARESFFAHYDGSKGVASADGGVSSWTPVDLNGNLIPNLSLNISSRGGASPGDITHDGDTLIFTDSSDPSQTRSLQVDLGSGLFAQSTVIWQGQYDSGGSFENSGSYAFNLGPNQSSHQRDDDGGEGFNIELFRGATTYIGESISMFDGNTTNWTTIATETGHTAFANNINLNVSESPTPEDLPDRNQLIVGAFSSTGFDFVGEMKHLILFQTALSEADRVLINRFLNTTVVTNSNCEGPGSLRAALANAPDTVDAQITFNSNLSGSIVSLDGSELLVDRSLTIDASNLPAGFIIDGGGDNFVQETGESRCIQIFDNDFASAITVTLNNLTLQNGSVSDGGGANLANIGEDVTLIDCQILNGRAFGSENVSAGGIFNLSGNLTMENCNISGNQVQAGGSAFGGGVNNSSGNLIMSNCSIIGNQAQAGVGGSAQGGGIYTIAGNLAIGSCSITDNRIVGENASGGGVFSNTNLQGQMTTLTRCTLSGNSAPNSPGGGLFNNFGSVILTHCTVTENTAGANAGGGLASSETNPSFTSVTASIVAGNAGRDIVFSNGESTSFASGGSNLIGDGNAVVVFSAGGDQTGITDPRLAPLADNGGPTLTHLPLPDSPAVDAASGFGSFNDQRGFPVDALVDIGAVELQQARVNTVAGGNTSDDDSSTSLRQAIEQLQPAPFELITFDPDLSGSIIRLGGSELLIDRSLTIDASDLSEGIIIDGGGDDFVQEDEESRCIQIFDSDSENAIDVTLNNLTLQNGSFEGENAGANLFNNGEDVTLINCQILNGRAFNSGFVGGGGILNLSGNLTMENCTVSGNQVQAGATAFGGGIDSSFGVLLMSNCSITSNQTQGLNGGSAQGGGIRTSSTRLAMLDCSITDNLAQGVNASGGGIFSNTDLQSQTTALIRCTLSGNSAPNSSPNSGGGGLFNNSGTVGLIHCTVTDNTAGPNAGGGLASSGTNPSFTSVTASIVAANSGGDIVFSNGESTSFISGGSNLIGDGNAFEAFDEEGDQTGITDPRLAPLVDNGGPTLTHLPLPDSPAVDAASGSGSFNDQRGFPVDALVDIGAVELQQARVNTLAGGNTSDEDNSISLRQAIEQFEPAPFELITFDPDLSGSIIRLGGSELLIDRSLTIDASNLSEGIIIDGGGNGNFIQEEGESRCIQISDGDFLNAITVTLNNLTLRNGSFEGGNAGANLFNNGEDVTLINCQILDGRAFSGATTTGGGIANLSGNLTMENCKVCGNQIEADQALGGGIYSTTGSLNLLNCFITGNQTEGMPGEFARGGGIFTLFSDLTMENCSITNNRTLGGIAQGGGIFSDTEFGLPTMLTRCTLSGNSAPGSQGGGLFNAFGQAILSHCTVTENTGGGLASFGDQFPVTTVTASIVAANSGGDIVFINGEINPFTSEGSNLIGDGNAVEAFDEEGDQTGISDPLLAPLADNGGPTLTHLPLPSSLAIDGASGSESTIDQRGLPINDSSPDVGSVERQNFLEGFEQIFDEDVDGDGTSVGVELAIGTNPFRPDAGDERNLRILPFDSSGELQLTFGVDVDAESEILLLLTRSIDLIDFDEILSNEVNDFEGPVIFSDPNPPEGQAFYRLEAIGLNLTI